MVRYVRLVLAVGGNVLVALSTLFSLIAYTSGDPSGLQYVGLAPAVGFAGAAIALGCLLGLLSLRRLWAWVNPALAAVALFLTIGEVSDLLGTVLGVVLLPLAVIFTVVVVRGLGELAA
jgi:hypothetical protein